MSFLFPRRRACGRCGKREAFSTGSIGRRRNGFAYVLAQLLPGISLGEDPFGQTLGDEAAIALPAYLKDHFRHGRWVAAPRPAIKPRARVHPAPLRRPAVVSTPVTRV